MPHNNASVLLIEDNPTLRRVLSLVLERAEYHVTAVGNAAGARRVARERAEGGGAAVDLVLCDVHLPDARGDLLVNELTPLLSPRAVVLLSGAGLPDATPQPAVVTPRVGFLQKPFDGDQLLEVARTMLS